MKLMFASDIHGSAIYCKKLIDAFDGEGADRLMLLGDVLYHGPRNALPHEYDTKSVAEMLNKIADKVSNVRGNCESTVDDMVLDFPVLSEYGFVCAGDFSIYMSHGHKPFPPLPKGSVVISGHTHIPHCYEENGVRYLNPGSVSIPKGGSERGYILFENNSFLWKTLDGTIYNSLSI